MKMKKMLATCLCSAMMLGMLSGCAAKPHEEFFRLYDEIQSIREGDYSSTLKIHIPKELSENELLLAMDVTDMEDLEDDIDISVILDGTQSLEDKQVSADILYSYNGNDVSPLTNIIVDESEVYVDVATLFDAGIELVKEFTDEAPSKEEIEAVRDELFSQINDKEWIKATAKDTTTGEEFDFWEIIEHVDVKDVPEDEEEETIQATVNFVKEIGNKAKEIIEVSELITKTEDKTYLLTVNNDSSLNIVNGVFDDFETNIDKYWGFIEVIAENSGEEVDDSMKEQIIESIPEGKEAVEDFLDDIDFSYSLELGYNKKAKEYTSKAIFEVENSFTIEVISTYSADKSPIKIPDAFDVDSLIEENMSDVVGSLNGINNFEDDFGYNDVDYSDPDYDEVDTDEEFEYIEEMEEIEEEETPVEVVPYEGDIDLENIDVDFAADSNRLFSIYAYDINKDSFAQTGDIFIDNFKTIASELDFSNEYTDYQELDKYISYDFEDEDGWVDLSLSLDAEDGENIYFEIGIYQAGKQNPELTKKFVETAKSYGYYLNEEKFASFIDKLFAEAPALVKSKEYGTFGGGTYFDNDHNLEIYAYVSYNEYNENYVVNIDLTESHYEW